MMQETKPTVLSADEQRRGMRLVYIGQGVGVPFNQLLTASAFGVLLIKHMGGSDLQAMILASLMLVTRFLQIPVSLLVPPERGKRFMLWCWSGCAMAMAAGLVATFLNIATIKVWLFLFCATVGMMSLNCGTTFWFPLLHDVVPQRMRGRFFGRMRTVWNATSFLAVVISGVFLGDEPAMWRYQVVLAVGLCMFLVRNVVIAQVPEARAPGHDDYANWKHYIRDILSRREVLVFCGYFSLLTFFSGFLTAPLVLYLERLGFPVGENILVYGGGMFGQILALIVAGVLTDRVGTKRVFAIAHVVLCVVCFCVVALGFLPFAIAVVLMPIATTTCGAMLATAHVACTVQLFHLAPDRGRAFFLSLGGILATGGMALSPLLAGCIDELLGKGWGVMVFGMHMDLFQVIFVVAGIVMAVLMAGLYFVEDIQNEDVMCDRGLKAEG